MSTLYSVHIRTAPGFCDNTSRIESEVRVQLANWSVAITRQARLVRSAAHQQINYVAWLRTYTYVDDKSIENELSDVNDIQMRG